MMEVFECNFMSQYGLLTPCVRLVLYILLTTKSSAVVVFNCTLEAFSKQCVDYDLIITIIVH